MPADPNAALFRDPDAQRLQRLAVAIARTARLLADDAAEAAEVQWEPAPIPRPREDTSERSKGAAPSNPTADAALDARRGALSDAVRASIAALTLAEASLGAARDRLRPALARWAGEAGGE